MRKSKQLEVPAPLARLGQRFIAWRKTRARGERIPAPLWNSAAKLAAKYGLNLTARTLMLDYYSLKERVDGGHGRVPSATFVELPSSTLPVPGEFVIEWEDDSGARMRVQVKGQSLPDVLALSRSFWNAD